MVSLTKAEFEERFNQRQGLFSISVEHEANQFLPLLASAIKVTTDGSNNIYISQDLSVIIEPLGKYLATTIQEVIELVYSETLS